MTAKKQSFQTTSYYLLSTDINELTKQSPHFIGKIRSNFVGTEFTIYDTGENPSKKQATLENTRAQWGVIFYESTILKTRGPKKMQVVLPDLNEDMTSKEYKPLTKDKEIQNQLKQNEEIYVFENKLPVWNDKLEVSNTFSLFFFFSLMC